MRAERAFPRRRALERSPCAVFPRQLAARGRLTGKDTWNEPLCGREEDYDVGTCLNPDRHAH